MSQPSSSRVAEQWLREAALFEAPPAMLKRATHLVLLGWAEGLLWHVERGKAALANAQALAIDNPLREMKRVRATIPQELAKAPEGEWVPFRHLERDQYSPEILEESLYGSNPNPANITRNPWRYETTWVKRLSSEEEEAQPSWRRSDSPLFRTVRDGRQRARQPGPKDGDLDGLLDLRSSLDHSLSESIETIGSARSMFEDLHSTLNDLEALALKYAPRAMEPKGHADWHVDMDLTGWKYLEPNEQPKGDLPPKITVRVEYGSSPRHVGYWAVHKWMLVAMSGEYALTREMMQRPKTLTTTVRHEMQHFAQDALRVIRGLHEDAGLPSSSIRTPFADPSGALRTDSSAPMDEEDPHNRIRHELRDVEFQTRLSDEVDRFLDALQDPEEAGSSVGIPVEHWRDFIKHFTAARDIDPPEASSSAYGQFRGWAQSQWFSYIKQHDKKRWEEAVRKFVSELDRRGIMRQIKRVKRWVPVADSKHPAWGTSVTAYFRVRLEALAPETRGWSTPKEVMAEAGLKHWPTIRNEYTRFIDSLSPEQIVRHKQIVNDYGDKWYFVNPTLQQWDGAEDLGGSKPPYADHPRLPKMHRYSSSACNPNATSTAWVEPSGKVHPLLRGVGHDIYAQMILSQRGEDESIYSGSETLIRQGWIRVVNFINVEFPANPSRQATEATARLILDCVLAYRDVLPEEDTVIVAVGSRRSEPSIADFIRQYGGREMEDEMFEGLMSRRTASAERVASQWLSAASLKTHTLREVAEMAAKYDLTDPDDRAIFRHALLTHFKSCGVEGIREHAQDGGQKTKGRSRQDAIRALANVFIPSRP